MAPTPIVLAVLHRQGLVCLLRRSPAVRTAPGLWGVVTGYLEPGAEPLQQALLEVQEEVGLEPARVRLARQAPPVLLTSSASGKQFLVYPFLFEASTEATVLNWEHDAVIWSEPSRLADADCVSWHAPLVQDLLAAGTQPPA